MRELFATFELDAIPTAIYWRDALRKVGHDVVLRYYGSKELNDDQVPHPDYSGYFLQLASRVETSNQGIMLSIKKKENTVHLTVTNWDDELEIVWRDLTTIISWLPRVLIHCGNCLFNSRQWQLYIETGEITDYIVGPKE